MNVELFIVFQDWTVKMLLKGYRNVDTKQHFYHGSMDPAQRAFIQKQLSKKEINKICATVAFGMGINKPDVHFCVLY